MNFLFFSFFLLFFFANLIRLCYWLDLVNDGTPLGHKFDRDICFFVLFHLLRAININLDKVITIPNTSLNYILYLFRELLALYAPVLIERRKSEPILSMLLFILQFSFFLNYFLTKFHLITVSYLFF